MAYLKKRKNNGLYEALLSLSFVFCYMTWLTTHKTVLVISMFILALVLILGLKIYSQKLHDRKLLQSGIHYIDRMDGKLFEEYLLALFKQQGYSGYITRDSADYGADLVIEKSGVKCVVQAKRWNEKVGISAIQEVIGAIKQYNAQRALVVTNSFFTSNAIELAKSNNVELWDRNYIISNLKKVDDAQVINSVEPDERICPKCSGKLVKRFGKNGSFYGCSNYPNCRYTQNI